MDMKGKKQVYLIVRLSATPSVLDWPQSLMSIFFSKTDNLSKIAIYKIYLEVEILGLDITKFDYQRG